MKKNHIYIFLISIVTIIVAITLLLTTTVQGREIINKISNAITNLNEKETDKKTEDEEGVLPIKISYSDFSINETIKKMVKEGDKEGTTEVPIKDNKLAKVEVYRKNVDEARIKVTYDIEINNKGNSEGTIQKILINVPNGMKLSNESTSNWSTSQQNTIEYKEEVELKVDETKNIELVMEGKASEIMGTVGVEAILLSSDDANQKIVEQEESTKINESNVKQKMKDTNNYSSVQVIVSINTGLINILKYLLLVLICLIIIAYITNKKIHQKR